MLLKGSLAGLAGVTGVAVRDVEGCGFTGVDVAEEAEEEVEEEEAAGTDEAAGGAGREVVALLINLRASCSFSKGFWYH